MDTDNLPLYHSDSKWALEPESKPEIEGIHLHHKDMSN